MVIIRGALVVAGRDCSPVEVAARAQSARANSKKPRARLGARLRVKLRTILILKLLRVELRDKPGEV
jgi:hypothetical protein